MGHFKAEELLLTAQMPTPKQAIKLGLVHALATKETLFEVVEQQLARYLAFGDVGRIATKMQLRGELAKKWEAYAEEEATGAWEGLSSPKQTAALEKVLARLSGAKAKL